MSKYVKAPPETLEEMELEFALAAAKDGPKRRNTIPPVCQSWLGMAACADLLVFVRTTAVQEAYGVAADGFRLLLHTLNFIGPR